MVEFTNLFNGSLTSYNMIKCEIVHCDKKRNRAGFTPHGEFFCQAQGDTVMSASMVILCCVHLEGLLYAFYRNEYKNNFIRL